MSVDMSITNDTFLISDTHFFHRNILNLSQRPYYNIDVMNEDIIKKWNNTISETDVVLHLGDVSFGKLQQSLELLDRLNGIKFLIKGNHDYKEHCEAYLKNNIFKNMYKSNELQYKNLVFSHKPIAPHMLKANFKNIHGHTHDKSPSSYDDPGFKKKYKKENYINVSVEQLNYIPIKLGDLIKNTTH